MKKFLVDIVLIILVSMNFICCDNDTYKMPYKPGVYVDEEKFSQQKELWEKNSVNNYSYTYIENYSFSNKEQEPIYNYVAEVSVKNGIISEVTLKEFNKQKQEDLPEAQWKSYTEDFFNNYKEIDVFLIENIYQKISDSIRNAYTEYQKTSKKYYAEINFDFSNKLPFLLIYNSYVVIMDENLDGNSGKIEIKIENFKEE